MVVSDRGEQWSPNTPPPATAANTATTMGFSSPPDMLKARGRAMGMQMAKVPQEEPVAKAITAATRKITAGSRWGVKKPSVTEMMKLAVPMDLDSTGT